MARALARLLVVALLTMATTIVVLVAQVRPAAASPALVQAPATSGSGSTPSGTIVATLGSPATVGNVVLAAYSWDSSNGSTTSCNDNAGNAYTVLATSVDSGAAQAMAVCYALVSSAGATTITVTLPASVGYRAIAVHEYAGASTSNPIGTIVSNKATATGGVTDSVTTTVASVSVVGATLFGAFENDSGSATGVAAGTGFTNRASVTSLVAAELTTEDRVVSSVGSYAATETWAVSRSYIGIAVVLLPATGVSVSQSDPSSSAAGVQDRYTLNGVTSSTTRCVKIAFSTSPGGSTKPTGLSVASATLNSSSTYPATPASWSIARDDTLGVITLTYATGGTSVMSSMILDGLVNPTVAGTYYTSVTSYSAVGCTGQIDSFTVALATTDGVLMSSVVTPSLTFSVAGRSSVCNGQSSSNFQAGSTSTAVNLGRVTVAAAPGGAQDLLVTSNAGGGFTVYIRTSGSAPNVLRDGSDHSIADVSGTNASPGAAPVAGIAGFGYTSSGAGTAFTSNTWAKLTTANEKVLSTSAGTSSGSACIGYRVAAGPTTAAGSYSASVVYTAVSVF